MLTYLLVVGLLAITQYSLAKTLESVDLFKKRSEYDTNNISFSRMMPP
jgi:hypothetical protein